ncbi:MAG: hypothetical protein U0289_14160 [Cyclobacteriaceae bacterium]
MKLLKHSKIDLEKIFNSDQQINVKLRRKVDGKQVYEILPTRLDSITKYLPYCYYIINQIIEYQLLRKHNWYIDMSSKHINQKINSDNRYSAISILVALGVIDANDHYNHCGAFGHAFCKSFKIASQYTGDIVEFEMDIRLVTSKKAKANNIIQSSVIDQKCIQGTDSVGCDTFDHYSKANGNIETLKECDTLESNLISSIPFNSNDNEGMLIPFYHTDYQLKNLKNINYDSKAAFELLEYQRANNLIELNKKNRSNLASDYQRIKLQIEKIVNKSVDFSIGNTGRVTTTVNQINAEYRSFIKDKHGNDLMEIDYKSSHLIHLIRVIEEDLSKGVIGEPINQELLKTETNDLKWLIENQDVYNSICIKYVSRFNEQITRDQAKENLYSKIG